ncbi:Crp/Fnr family transcriptional regulator [uncultured Kordia sp.]|uniref:Crp/Fnr family transcriptional regulator n=1 Tax=uncultured Kordia sp. TaxID=507699 RepID=UPI00261A806C|nr:Crp/Fnr family transcriptional regulator [uncultured Kordia sp.]
MAHKLFKALEMKGLYKCNTYSQNETVKHFYQTNSRKVYLVKSGILKISYPNELGEKITSIILMKDQFFGFAQFFCDSNINYSYEAILDGTVLHEFYISHVNLMLDTNAISKSELFFSVGKEYSLLEKRIMILQNRFIKKRLCKTISEFGDSLGVFPFNAETIHKTIPINQDELASYIRASRIITNKILNDFKKNVFRDCINN